MNTASKFVAEFKALQVDIHATAREKGWWENRDNLEIASQSLRGEHDRRLEKFARVSNQISCLMLVVTEIAEAVEAIRHGNPPDDKIPNFSGAEAECADAIIRLMDLAEREGWDLAGAIVEKAEMNKGRAHMHGGKKA